MHVSKVEAHQNNTLDWKAIFFCFWLNLVAHCYLICNDMHVISGIDWENNACILSGFEDNVMPGYFCNPFEK